MEYTFIHDWIAEAFWQYLINSNVVYLKDCELIGAKFIYKSDEEYMDLVFSITKAMAHAFEAGYLSAGYATA